GRAGHVGPLELAPPVDALAQLVDELGLLDAVDRLLGVAQLLLGAGLLLGRRHRHEVLAGATALDDLIGDAVLVEPEVARGRVERRVQDRVLDPPRAHRPRTTPLRTTWHRTVPLGRDAARRDESAPSRV